MRYRTTDCRFRVGQKIRILCMDGEPSYNDRVGIIEEIDDIDQLHGTWGSLAVIPDIDIIEIIDDNLSKS